MQNGQLVACVVCGPQLHLLFVTIIINQFMYIKLIHINMDNLNLIETSVEVGSENIKIQNTAMSQEDPELNTSTVEKPDENLTEEESTHPEYFEEEVKPKIENIELKSEAEHKIKIENIDIKIKQEPLDEEKVKPISSDQLIKNIKESVLEEIFNNRKHIKSSIDMIGRDGGAAAIDDDDVGPGPSVKIPRLEIGEMDDPAVVEALRDLEDSVKKELTCVSYFD